ncbi:hypothetical protein C2E23DRAFT_536646 [Lenzites betulinus]|nr:hypothetical protein C2E23DRAFT_536646 [Lenzites betulinus]
MQALETKSLADERTPLLPQGACESQAPVAVLPMKRSDIPRGADTIHRAFLEDSLMVYFTTVDTAPFAEARAKARYYLMFDSGIRQNRVLTVDAGKAAMKYQIPGGPGDPWPHVYAEAVLRKVADTRELTKRLIEFVEKVKELVLDAFGEKVADMYEIQSLGTAPEVQGRGYGSALVTAVTDMADADGHDVWLVTTDAYAFYEGLGFSIIRSATLGDENPTWEGEPVPIRVMVRRTKGIHFSEKNFNAV